MKDAICWCQFIFLTVIKMRRNCQKVSKSMRERATDCEFQEWLSSKGPTTNKNPLKKHWQVQMYLFSDQPLRRTHTLVYLLIKVCKIGSSWLHSLSALIKDDLQLDPHVAIRGTRSISFINRRLFLLIGVAGGAGPHHHRVRGRRQHGGLFSWAKTLDWWRSL